MVFTHDGIIQGLSDLGCIPDRKTYLDRNLRQRKEKINSRNFGKCF